MGFASFVDIEAGFFRVAVDPFKGPISLLSLVESVKALIR